MNVALIIASTGFITGFLLGCLPTIIWMASVWEKPYGKTPVILLHLMVLLISTVLARWAVAEALGLPPQSFDMSVSFLALAFYIPAWMLVIALILVFVGTVTFAAIALLSVAMTPVLHLVRPIASAYRGGAIEQLNGKLQAASNHLLLNLFRVVGAIVTGLSLMAGYAAFSHVVQPYFGSSIRWLAVVTDFQSASQYPGVNAGERIHPLDNGFSAVAYEQADHSLYIGVRKQVDHYDAEGDHSVSDPLPSAKQLMTPLVSAVARSVTSLQLLLDPER
ncbi:hypothetical protein [Pseudomonas viridiflava]|uniref:hypothetical protein n=1 Tax=Pseudomonas viridiflava TaxID=33069 RepID=UPI0013D493F2|nr:hypothetical protein [Pseudomonas viridiflava]